MLTEEQHQQWKRDLEELHELQSENEKLKEFARFVIRTECWSMFEHDGGSIQDLAEKLGLIESHIATEEEVDTEFDDYGPGDTIFKFSKILIKQALKEEPNATT